ncbi:hypothetical protein RhiJN_21288 [Ceratobasidium sp. AG-Ba]|nr:hypothetical protein RhiJN_21288 [Ceratobasidium sp. AG-Ba]
MLRIAEENASDDGLDDEKIIIATCPECRCPYTHEKICSFRNEYLANSDEAFYSNAGSSAVDNNSSAAPSESVPPATNTASVSATDNLQPTPDTQRGETPSPILASTLDGDSVRPASPESAQAPPADKSDAIERAAIKRNFEEQAASMLGMLGKKPRSIDLDKLVQLHFDVDDWLDIERREGRLKEHVLLDASMKALMYDIEYAE